MILPIPTTDEKYNYIAPMGIMHKPLIILSFFSWMLLLYGFFLAFKHNPIYLGTFGVMIIFIASFLLVSNFISFFYKNFDKKNHLEKVENFWKSHKYSAAKIDILLPICGEDFEVVKNTWIGVANLAERYPGQVSVYVLDDKGLTSNEILAAEFSFNYISRPNKGEMKKAGNLNHGLKQTNGDFIVILDADFRPHMDFIHELLPYMENEKVAIVQSPQYFELSEQIHKQSMLQYGAANIQEYFYRIIQRSRGAFDGSICVGSNAIYRRDALNTIGGTALKEHSEDVWTGFKLLNKGWKIQYLPLILAKGTCPDDLYSFFKQQTRWCSGSLSLLTSQEFWKSNLPLRTKVPYFSGFMYYISNPLMLFLPFQNFVLLWDPHVTSDSTVLFFTPSIFISTTLLLFYVYPKAKLGTLLAHNSAVWSYTYAILGKLFGRVEMWQPTGGKNKLTRGFKIVTALSSAYILGYLYLLFITIKAGKIELSPQYALVILWICINLFVQTLFVSNVWKYIIHRYSSEINGFFNKFKMHRIEKGLQYVKA